jgi:hypothetical protein
MQGGQRHIRVVGRQRASAVSRVNINAVTMLSTAKARVLMRPARVERSGPAESALFYQAAVAPSGQKVQRQISLSPKQDAAWGC